MKKVTISLIDYNGRDKTLACLRSLDSLTLKGVDLDVVVIDNYPQGEFSLGKERFSHFTPYIIKTEKNKGFAGGHNVGIACADEKNADYVLVLNNDTVVDKNLVVELVQQAEEHEAAGAVVPKIYFQKGHEFHKDRYKEAELGRVFWYAGGYMDWNNIVGLHRGVDEVDHGQYDKAEEVDLMTGCCVLFPMSVLRKTGGFDERYFLYYEDADLNERMKRHGFSIRYAPKAVLWHANAGSTGGSGSVLQDYFISRNRMLFGMQYAPVRTRIALFRESMRLLRTGREWQKRGIKDYYLRKFGRGSFAL